MQEGKLSHVPVLDWNVLFQFWHKSTAGHFDTSQPFRVYFLSSAHYLSLHSDALSTDAFLISSALKHTVSEILPYVNTYVSVSISIWCRAVFIFFFPSNRNYRVYTITFPLYLKILVSLNKLIKVRLATCSITCHNGGNMYRFLMVQHLSGWSKPAGDGRVKLSETLCDVVKWWRGR